MWSGSFLHLVFISYFCCFLFLPFSIICILNVSPLPFLTLSSLSCYWYFITPTLYFLFPPPFLLLSHLFLYIFCLPVVLYWLLALILTIFLSFFYSFSSLIFSSFPFLSFHFLFFLSSFSTVFPFFSHCSLFSFPLIYPSSSFPPTLFPYSFVSLPMPFILLYLCFHPLSSTPAVFSFFYLTFTFFPLPFLLNPLHFLSSLLPHFFDYHPLLS